MLLRPIYKLAPRDEADKTKIGPIPFSESRFLRALRKGPEGSLVRSWSFITSPASNHQQCESRTRIPAIIAVRTESMAPMLMLTGSGSTRLLFGSTLQYSLVT